MSKRTRQQRRAAARRRKMSVTINNSENDALYITCAATADTTDDNPRFKFEGYSGGAVDLSDYGFDHPVVYDLPTLTNKPKVPILQEHHQPIGHADRIDNDGKSLSGEGPASYPGQARDEVLNALKGGFPFEASMGLRVPNKKKDIAFHNNGATVNGRRFDHPVYVVKNGLLKEMTITLSGRDGDTVFQLLNSEDLKALKGQLPTGGSPAPAGGTPAPNPGTPGDPGPVHTGRIDNTTLMALKLTHAHPDHYDLIINGLAEGWNEERIQENIQLAEMNNRLPKPPSPGTFQSASLESRIVSRMMLSFGCAPETVENNYGKKIADYANDLPQMGITEALVEIANAAGGRFNGHSDVEVMCEYIKNTAYSAVDYPDFFEKVATAMKEERWALNPPLAPQICKEANNRDLNPTQRKRVTGGEMWPELGDTDKLDILSMAGQKTYLSKLKTHGGLFVLTRGMVLADDMDVIRDFMEAMVEGAIFKPDYLLGLKMLDQAPAANSFWIDDDNSFDSTALDRTNLSARYKAVRQYVESKEQFDWTVIRDYKWRLIHGPDLEEDVFDLLMQSTILPSGGPTSATARTGDKNYFFGRFTPTMFPQMGNTSAFKSSQFADPTSWVLWPMDTRVAPYDITYLRGRKTPVIKSVPMPMTLLGTATQGYWDVNINERERQFIARCKA
jgi:hypothetical protein